MMSRESASVNRLIHERSPYLLQHAHNPVDWYPWGAEAFERATREDKPIFLSIGYSTCHWCHVMAHESFEDPEVAGILNHDFISIKVDREERPDIDQVYLMVCQAMTGQGGWPLTIMMTPMRKPFFAATYLPPKSRSGMPGLLDLLPRLVEAWKNRREDIEQYSEEVIEALRTEEPASRVDPSLQFLDRAYQILDREFDPRYGGFGTAPKFPSPHQLLFLLRIWYRRKDPRALAMVEKTLQEMRKGGIFDQVGFGLHRYSVDEQWIVPHFEKTLYDQALFSIACLEAYQVTGDCQYSRMAREIFTYVLRDLAAEKGGFYAGEDADSEGKEGRYYLWTWKELEEALDSADLMLISQVYGVQKEGNVPIFLQGAPAGANILHQVSSYENITQAAGISDVELHLRLERVLAILREVRSQRMRPGTDTKILADWNGLIIAALAFGGRVLDEADYTEAAIRASAAILGPMRRSDGRLNHAYSTDEPYIDAFSSDYAALVWGEIELYETTFDTQYLQTAIELMQRLAEWYRDPKDGGYFLTPADSESLPVRKKEVYDGAMPSANSLAVYNWLRLASLTGKSEYSERGLQDWQTLATAALTAPQGFTFLLIAADYWLGPAQQVIISGNPAAADTKGMVRSLAKTYLPRMTVHLQTEGSAVPLGDLAPFIRAYPAPEDEARAFVCTNSRCLPPTSNPAEMIESLSLSK
jgi:uncharacterized protein YyaL (SSP411 family)